MTDSLVAHRLREALDRSGMSLRKLSQSLVEKGVKSASRPSISAYEDYLRHLGALIERIGRDYRVELVDWQAEILRDAVEVAQYRENALAWSIPFGSVQLRPLMSSAR